MLFGGVGAVAASVPTQTAQAKYHDPYKYDKHFYHVLILERTKVYRIHYGRAMCYNRYHRVRDLRPGQMAWIRNKGGIDWSWSIGRGYHYCNFSRDSKDYDWFEPYHKYEYVDKEVIDNANHEEHKVYRFTWRQFCKITRYGIWNKPYRKWAKPVKRLIRREHVKLEKD